MAFSKDFFTNTHKVLFITEKLTGNYHDWFSSHSVRNPEVLQDYYQFVSSLLSFSVHHKIPDKLDSLIKEVVKWNQKYLLTKSSSISKLSPNAKTFSSKTTTLLAPPPGTEPRPRGGFCLTSEEILGRRTNNLCSYCRSKDHLMALCPLSKQSNPVTSSTSLNSLMSKDSSISLTVIVTVHGPLSKVSKIEWIRH
ncbi:hypothetical protein DSO57_1036220 [Entomophthora muscae]|uniref:Uncharacterized protein n=1 Tax=Entomophthora muscae TaxID=34485 RepID=A0ACC2UJR3_9FUNG|nr:hypothetical protein DSO57_1036220 [Entomophthora muscae]